MRLIDLQEARSLGNQTATFWELWGVSGGRGGPSWAEFGFDKHEVNIAKGELPDAFFYNIIHNNSSIVTFNEIKQLAKEELGYAIEDMEEGADIDDPETDYKLFMDGVKEAQRSNGIAVSIGVDDWSHNFVTDVNSRHVIYNALVLRAEQEGEEIYSFGGFDK